jgi:hypothetical protein
MYTLLLAATLLSAQGAPAKPVKPARPVSTEPAPFKGTKAYCYFNEKTLTWRIGNDAVERTIDYDYDTKGLKTTSVRVMSGRARLAAVAGSEGEIMIAPAGSQAGTTLRLDKDWAYTWQSVATPAHGGRLLTVHMQGINTNNGYEVEVMYEVWPGNRPYLGKSVTFINRTSAPLDVREVVYDRWVVATPPAGKPKKDAPAPRPAEFSRASDGSGRLFDEASGTGVLAAVVSPQGSQTFQNGAIVQRFTGAVTAAPGNGRAYLPEAIIAPFTGTAAVADILYQRYSSK